MYVIPKTNIRLLKNVPLEASYTNTLYFSSTSAQTNYFSGLTKKNLNNYTYQRVNNGQLKVGILADEIYDCNYMMFQNSAYGNKWFYAFITKVEYVSNTCSTITYELDVIQTWFFDFTLAQCFVEREHPVSDNIGEHILPEPLALGEYTFNNFEKLTDQLDDMGVIIASVDTGESATEGNVYDGVYSGAIYRAYRISDVAGINEYVEQYVQSPDSIIAMYMCPEWCIPTIIPDTGGVDIPTSTNGRELTVELDSIDSRVDDFDGYTPKNNKLYTYPYYYLHIDNASGESLTLRFEFFSGGTPRVKLSGSLSTPVKITCRPQYYKGVNELLQTEILTLQNYPQCSWNIDTFKVWLSQNVAPTLIKSASGIFQTAAGIGTATAGSSMGNPVAMVSGAKQAVSGGTSLLNTAINFLSDMYTASIQADMCKGNINNGNVNLAQGYQTFFVGRAHITKEYAQMYDDFFSYFGYATKRIKVPNTHSRPHWNYVKTAGCLINGSVPADDERKICAIHDSGITYWKNGSEVGNYTLDNSP